MVMNFLLEQPTYAKDYFKYFNSIQDSFKKGEGLLQLSDFEFMFGGNREDLPFFGANFKDEVYRPKKSYTIDELKNFRNETKDKWDKEKSAINKLATIFSDLSDEKITKEQAGTKINQLAKDEGYNNTEELANGINTAPMDIATLTLADAVLEHPEVMNLNTNDGKSSDELDYYDLTKLTTLNDDSGFSLFGGFFWHDFNLISMKDILEINKPGILDKLSQLI